MKSARVSGMVIPLFLSAAPALAQCEPVWSGLGGHDGYGGESLAVYDEDGPGPTPPALFVGNGLDDVRLVARWDGWEATTVGGGPFDPGIHHIEPLPEPIGALAAGLYVCGDLTMIDGVPVNGIARWDGEQWHDVGGGVGSDGFVVVFAAAVFDEDGEGALPPSLFVGGQFRTAGGVPVEGLAKWDGTQWSNVGGGLSKSDPTLRVNVNAMTVYDDGRGPALYVGGSFRFAGGKDVYNIARWDGVEWEPVGSGLATTVNALCVFDEDGPGPRRPVLFAGGQFNSAAGAEPGSMARIGRWDGAEWTPVGGFLPSAGAVKAMMVWDPDGAGPERESLYAGGFFSRLPDGTLCNKIARWDGERWHALGAGVTGFGAGTQVNTLAAFDEDGPGPNPGGLYVGGAFYYAGGVYSKHIARWGCPLPPSPTCYADCDADGELAFFDFLCFQNLFAAADPGADCDSDGEFTFFDFLCFQNAFAAGCP
jgi:hypothetical protein